MGNVLNTAGKECAQIQCKDREYCMGLCYNKSPLTDEDVATTVYFTTNTDLY
jgi:hypothetical protein